MDKTDSKKCTKCNECFVLNNFSIGKAECKKCSSERFKKWREINKKSLKEYYEINKKHISVRNKKWKESNLDKVKEKRKERDKKNQQELIIKRKIYRQNNVDKLRDYNLKKRFNISLEEYNIMLRNQNEVCAICKRPERMMHNGKIKYLCVDHNHETGAVRKLLCHGCNTAIALLDENINFLNNAIDYLK